MSAGGFSAYVFDLDGTLFTIPVDWAEVREEVARLAGGPFDAVPLFMKVEQLVSVHPSMKETLFALLDRHELAAVGGAKPTEGAVALLQRLEKGSRLGLVTMQGLAACDRLLGRYHVGELFDVIVTREDSLDRGEQVRLALKTLGARPEETLFTGDRLNDVAGGRKAGVKTALLGKPREGDLRPDYVFATLDSLRESLA